jgi:diguanylate cyclase (GGDEF)-like protein/PAS domain S-box-containing protein
MMLKQQTAELTHLNLELSAGYPRQLKDLKALYEITQTLLTSSSPQEMAAGVIYHIQRWHQYQYATVSLVDLDAGEVLILAADFENDFLKNGQNLPLTIFQNFVLLREGQPFVVDDLLTLARSRSLLEERLLARGIRSYVVIPLLAHNELTGALSLGAVAPYAFQAPELELLGEVAGHLAPALYNARFYQALHQQAEELAALNMISQAIIASLELSEILNLLAEHASHLLNVAATRVILHDEVEQNLWLAAAFGREATFVGRRFPLNEGIAGWIFQHGAPLLVSEAQDEAHLLANSAQPAGLMIHSVLGVPLQVKGQTIGVVEAMNKQVASFNQRDLHLLTSLAATATIAIEHARLYQQTQQELFARRQMEEELQRYRHHLEELVERRTAELKTANERLRAHQAELELHNKELRVAQSELKKTQSKYFDLYHLAPIGYFTFDRKGLILELNVTGAKLLGQEREKLIGRPLSAFLTSPSNLEFYAHRQVVLKQPGAAHTSELTLLQRDGGQIYVQMESIAAQDDRGDFSLCRSVIMDITALKETEEALLLSQERYALAVSAGKVGVWDWNIKTNELYLDPNLKALLGYRDHEIPNRPDEWLKLVHPEDLKQIRAMTRAYLRGAQPRYEFERRMIHKDGSLRWILCRGTAIRDEHGHACRMMGTDTDVTELKQIQEALYKSEERYTLAARGANDGLWDWNLQTSEIYFSPRWKAMLGYVRGEINHSPEEWFNRVHPEDVAALQADIAAHHRGETIHLQNEHRILHYNGTYRWMLCRGVTVRDELGRPYRMVGSLTDITQRKMFEEQLMHDALHDALTGLPNRALFMKRLTEAVARARDDRGYLFAVLFLDLDHFKVVNDSLGHAVGDLLLITIAHRLKICVRAGDTIARLGGDEFTVLLSGISNVSEAEYVAERIQQQISQTVELSGHEIFPTVSIGVTLSTDGYERAEDLLRDADTAMYKAKAQGRARQQVFDPVQHTQAVTRFHLESDLRQALKRGELQVYYQPIVSLQPGAGTSPIVGVEALLRWHHPQQGLLSPADFIALAEETGLIIPISDWMLDMACLQVRVWQKNFLPALRLAVNLSARQFEQNHLLHSITAVLRKVGLPPCFLELEITEQSTLRDQEKVLPLLSDLKACGVQISVDDFGTRSSLELLKLVPVDTLKIAQSFIKGMTSDDAAIVTAIIAMAHSLNLKVIAEGVETKEQVNFLRVQRCDEAQGYLFSPPLPAAELAVLLR